MIVLDANAGVPMYEQVYEAVKVHIEQGLFRPGQRLPSIRAMAAQLGVSKITVEQAYLQLATEGYIQAHNKAPYEVLEIPQPLGRYYDRVPHTAIPSNQTYGIIGDRVESKQGVFSSIQQKDLPQSVTGDTNHEPEELTSYRDRTRQCVANSDLDEESNRPPHSILYNFATGAMDPEGFDFKRWKRFIGYALRDTKRLMTYGQLEGEPELREALNQYLQQARGVRATAERVLVTSGTLNSLHMIASLLQRQGKSKVAVDRQSPSFAKALWKDYGFSVVEVDTGMPQWISTLEAANVEVVYCMPSHGDSMGRIMTIQERTELLRWAQSRKAFIIEDDYDSELRYYGKPVLSLQGMDLQDCVIYMGTPSKVLPPSIRLSYLVLPVVLYEDFHKHRKAYGQSAGVLEQLAWAMYMDEGEWHKQIRRLRKHYLEKSKYFTSLLRHYLDDTYEVIDPEGGVYAGIRKAHTRGDVFRTRALQAGCDIKVIDRDETGIVEVLLSFSGIPTRDLERAVQVLAEAWKGL